MNKKLLVLLMITVNGSTLPFSLIGPTSFFNWEHIKNISYFAIGTTFFYKLYSTIKQYQKIEQKKRIKLEKKRIELKKNFEENKKVFNASVYSVIIKPIPEIAKIAQDIDTTIIEICKKNYLPLKKSLIKEITKESLDKCVICKEKFLKTGVFSETGALKIENFMINNGCACTDSFYHIGCIIKDTEYSPLCAGCRREIDYIEIYSCYKQCMILEKYINIILAAPENYRKAPKKGKSQTQENKTIYSFIDQQLNEFLDKEPDEKIIKALIDKFYEDEDLKYLYKQAQTLTIDILKNQLSKALKDPQKKLLIFNIFKEIDKTIQSHIFHYKEKQIPYPQFINTAIDHYLALNYFKNKTDIYKNKFKMKVELGLEQLKYLKMRELLN